MTAIHLRPDQSLIMFELHLNSSRSSICVALRAASSKPGGTANQEILGLPADRAPRPTPLLGTFSDRDKGSSRSMKGRKSLSTKLYRREPTAALGLMGSMAQPSLR